MDEIKSEKFISEVVDLFKSAKKNLVTAVNMSMVYSYYEAGRMIVEEEQHGKERAEYGKGFSLDNLKLMRRFYKVFSKDTIGETAFPQSDKLPKTIEGRKFYLSW